MRVPLIAALLFVAPPAVEAASYVVATTGNDNDDGALKPWRTLQHAANVVMAGDTVRVRAGGYVGFDLRALGAAQRPISFLADPGVSITARNAKTPDGINVENAAWVVVDGFTVNDMPRTGIRAALSNHVTIRRSSLDHNGSWGILTGFCDDLLIEDNVGSRSIKEHGIYVSNSGDRPIIRRNRLFSNNGVGIHMNGDASLGGDGLISNALVEANLIYDNGRGGGAGINCDGVVDSVIQNNLLYDNHATGIALFQGDGAMASSRNRVVNNTIVQAADGRWGILVRDGAVGNHLLNNIVYNLHPSRGSINVLPDSRMGLISDYNVVMDRFTVDDANVITLLAWRKATGQDAHSLLAAPPALFVDFAARDFHLALAPMPSPARDVGTAMEAPARDLEGTPRPLGNGFDVGAYEACPAPCARDAGVDLAVRPDLATTVDAAARADLARAIDAAPLTDLAPGGDAASSPDLMNGVDAAAAEDLAAAPDLAAAIDAAGEDAAPPLDLAATSDAARVTDLALRTEAGEDAGAAAPAPGCGCRVGARANPWSAIAALPLLLALRRRRRRR